jgi:hypothetical protein
VKRSSILGFGATSAYLVGALSLLAGATHFLLPRDQLRGATGVDAAFFDSLAASSAVFQAHYWIMVLSCLFGIGVILAFFLLLRGHQSGFLCWTAVLGVVGAALAASDFALVAVESPRLAGLYAASPPAAQSALLLQGVPHIDPCFFGWGLMGMFWLAANATALRTGRLPRILGLLGILQALLFFLGFAGALGRSALLVDMTTGLGGLVVVPAWSFWFGWTLHRVVQKESVN